MFLFIMRLVITEPNGSFYSKVINLLKKGGKVHKAIRRMPVYANWECLKITFWYKNGVTIDVIRKQETPIKGK